VQLVWEQCAGGAVGETFSGSKVGSVGSYVGAYSFLYIFFSWFVLSLRIIGMGEALGGRIAVANKQCERDETGDNKEGRKREFEDCFLFVVFCLRFAFWVGLVISVVLVDDLFA
jgi:hypothetical protein